MWSGIEQSGTKCFKCGKEMMWRICPEIDCDDGIITDESDPGWDEASYYCSTCKGTGIEQWCQSCGYGLD